MVSPHINVDNIPALSPNVEQHLMLLLAEEVDSYFATIQGKKCLLCPFRAFRQNKSAQGPQGSPLSKKQVRCRWPIAPVVCCSSDVWPSACHCSLGSLSCFVYTVSGTFCFTYRKVELCVLCIHLGRSTKRQQTSPLSCSIQEWTWVLGTWANDKLCQALSRAVLYLCFRRFVFVYTPD